MTARHIFAVLAVFSLAIPTHAQEETVAGKTATEWAEILQNSDNVRLRRGAALALGIIGSKSPLSMPTLIRALREEPEEIVRRQVVTSLEQIQVEDPASIVGALATALKSDKAAPIRAAAAAALGRLGDDAESALPALSSGLADEDAATRAASAEAIGKLGSAASETAPQLVPLLEDKDLTVRLNATFALGRTDADPAQVGEPLAKRLAEDESTDVRRSAARSLGLLNAADQTLALAKALTEDQAPEVRRAAVLALTRIGPLAGPAADALKQALVSDDDKSVRSFAVHALVVCLGDNAASAVPILAERLAKDEVGEVRLVIATELGALGPAATDAIPALTAARRDVLRTVREAAGVALKKIQKDGGGDE